MRGTRRLDEGTAEAAGRVRRRFFTLRLMQPYMLGQPPWTGSAFRRSSHFTSTERLGSIMAAMTLTPQVHG